MHNVNMYICVMLGIKNVKLVTFCLSKNLHGREVREGTYIT